MYFEGFYIKFENSKHFIFQPIVLKGEKGRPGPDGDDVSMNESRHLVTTKTFYRYKTVS